jgi:hypothetical protein
VHTIAPGGYPYVLPVLQDFENGAKPATQAPALSSALAETECTVGYLSARDFVESGQLMKTILEASIAADGNSGDEGEQGWAAHQVAPYLERRSSPALHPGACTGRT